MMRKSRRSRSACAEIDKGRALIVDFYHEHEQSEAAEKSAELSFLDEWREELQAKRPMSKIEKMRQEMDAAIQSEAYEKAAQLRDAIRALDDKQQKRLSRIREVTEADE